MNAHRGIALLVLMWVGCSGQTPVQVEVNGPLAVQPGPLLSDARLALAGSNATSWQQYVAKSKLLAQADRDTIEQELRRANKSVWTPAPIGSDYRIPYSSGNAWYGSSAAMTQALNAISFQTPAGGWSKAVDFSQPRQPGQSYSSTSSWDWIGTFDNSATTEELRLIAEVLRTQSSAKLSSAFTRGLSYILDAQMPNGCWPQVWPLEGSYHDAATLNDNMHVNIMAVLSSVSNGTYAFTTSDQRTKASTALSKALACILDMQVTENGALTVWGQQSDPITLQPTSARAYEPVSLVSMESAPVMDLLMSLPAPDARTVASVKAAAAWFKQSAIYGVEYDMTTGVLQQKPGAGPTWARFYELNTNRPIFGDRDGSVHYDVSEISLERRTGYAWYVTNPAATLQRYEVWAKSH